MWFQRFRAFSLSRCQQFLFFFCFSRFQHVFHKWQETNHATGCARTNARLLKKNNIQKPQILLLATLCHSPNSCMHRRRREILKMKTSRHTIVCTINFELCFSVTHTQFTIHTQFDDHRIKATGCVGHESQYFANKNERICTRLEAKIQILFTQKCEFIVNIDRVWFGCFFLTFSVCGGAAHTAPQSCQTVEIK